MALGRFLERLFGGGLDERELARRLGLLVEDLVRVDVRYETFEIPKRSGGMRTIHAPAGPLKELQQRVLRRLIGKLPVHDAAHGFVEGRSIVTHARQHAGRAVVLHMDLKDFFPSTQARHVASLYGRLGWNRRVTKSLTAWTTWQGGLPQGAPTSPLLSNVLNVHLDARLTGLARSLGARYSRYADDLTFSWAEDHPRDVKALLHVARGILEESGYRMHTRKKLRVLRRHQRQTVTGLVVNERVDLPRTTRRWLRAVEHRVRTGREATLTPEQLAGWRALRSMIDVQRSAPDRPD